MSTYSSTSTYTVADVEKVMRSVKTDLVIIASTTRAMTEIEAANYAHDIETLAKKNHLKFADVTLMSGTTELRAIKYEFQTEGASGTERPGGVTWPMTPKESGGRIRINLGYMSGSTAEERAKLSLKYNWVSSDDDLNHQALTSGANRGYSSNGFGADRKDYS